MGYVPIPQLITKMALPAIFSMLIQALYNVVDSIFVSRVSEGALTAVTLAFPMQIIVIAAFVGLATGMNSAISRKLGAKDKEQAVQVAEHGVLIGIVLYIIVALAGIFIAPKVFQGFTENPQIIEYGISYIQIVMIFSFGSIMNHAGMSIFRGTGEMVKPMIAQTMGAVINMILDPILIFGWFGLPAMGVRGAAIATVTAQIISMLFIWLQIFAGKSILKLNLKKFRLRMNIIRQIVSVGLPSTVMQALGSVMLFALNYILSRFGDSAIAVMGVYFRIQSLVFMPVFGLNIGTMPVVGYNYGARNKERILSAVKFSTMMAVIFTTMCMVIIQLIPDKLLMLFDASPAMMQIGIPAFRRISIIFPFAAVSIVLSTTFQGLGKAYHSLIIAMIRQLVILLPVGFYLAQFNDINLFWSSFWAADILGTCLTVVLFLHVYRRNVKTLEPLEANTI